MDEVDRSLRDLIDSLDLHPRYSLRRTDSRHRRLLESLDLSNPSSIMAPPTTTSPSTGATTTTTASPTQCSQLYGITVKFCDQLINQLNQRPQVQLTYVICEYFAS